MYPATSNSLFGATTNIPLANYRQQTTKALSSLTSFEQVRCDRDRKLLGGDDGEKVINYLSRRDSLPRYQDVGAKLGTA